MNAIIYIDKKCWESTMKGLLQRSKGVRESACIWAGVRYETEWRVNDIIFLDDLKGTQKGRLFHSTPREASKKAFEILRGKGLQIIADVHTHPEKWVGLSPVDMQHPIEYRTGLLAIVIPHYARYPVTLNNLGVHEYLGSTKWRQLPLDEVKKRFIIGG